MKKKLVRTFLLALAIVLAVALPYQALKTLDSYQAYEDSRAYSNLRLRSIGDAKKYAAGVKRYKEFKDKVEEYVIAAKESGAESKAWVRYEVDIENRAVPVSLMRVLLDNARHGEQYYFDPTELEITSPVYVNEAGQGIQSLLTEDGAELGSKVLVTLKGTYMVFQRQ
ncbi:hypothetical protein [Magnetofaba australis]|uniref:Uncharacterized protein n=1 Tax=Magnetofaba australis IT-1 TaxID=1434232 RepID=A0A1Y2K5V8_9PROT|nr:hypothetical protein [Magnetofaba australis]OSM04404.1 hypothetical protein MAIT1_04314 [Magnetofaba australis IT-1]